MKLEPCWYAADLDASAVTTVRPGSRFLFFVLLPIAEENSGPRGPLLRAFERVTSRPFFIRTVALPSDPRSSRAALGNSKRRKPWRKAALLPPQK